MNNFKKSSYTIILLVTIFLLSPFMIHKIWKNSEEAKKKTAVPPPTAQTTTAAPQEGDKPQNEEAGENTADAAGEQEGAEITEDSIAPAEKADLPEVQYQTVSTSYFDNALFIGDSRTVGLSEYGTLKNADYFCDVGLSAAGINDTYVDGLSFEQKIGSKQYGKVYLMLGINECGNDFESTMTAYRSIVEKLKVHQSSAVIYLMANLHVAATAETGAITNSNIEYLNQRMGELADNKQVFFLDVNEVYTDKNGYLIPDYSSDGVHPYGEYYPVWCDWLCQHAVVQEGTVVGADENYTEVTSETATE